MDDRGDDNYRRGVHQALNHALAWLLCCRDIDEARWSMVAAGRKAHDIRYERPRQPHRLLLDEIDDAIYNRFPIPGHPRP